MHGCPFSESKQWHYVYVRTCTLVHDGPHRGAGLCHRYLWACIDLGGLIDGRHVWPDGFNERLDVPSGLVWLSQWLSTLRSGHVQLNGWGLDVHALPRQHVRERGWSIHVPSVPERHDVADGFVSMLLDWFDGFGHTHVEPHVRLHGQQCDGVVPHGSVAP